MKVRRSWITSLYAEIKRNCQHRILYPEKKNPSPKMQNKSCFRKTKAEGILCQQSNTTRNANENSLEEEKWLQTESKIYTKKWKAQDTVNMLVIIKDRSAGLGLPVAVLAACFLHPPWHVSLPCLTSLRPCPVVSSLRDELFLVKLCHIAVDYYGLCLRNTCTSHQNLKGSNPAFSLVFWSPSPDVVSGTWCFQISCHSSV